MSFNDLPNDPKAEVDELRNRVNSLSTPVDPALANAAAKTKAYAKQATDTVSTQTEAVTDWARSAPFKALLAACGVGYLVGRIVR